MPIRIRSMLPIALLVLAACAAPDGGSTDDGASFDVLPAEVAAAAASLRDHALEDERAWQFVEGLTSEVGHRFAGSPQDAEAVQWAKATLEAWGLANVRAEPVTVPRWIRGDEAGHILGADDPEVVLVALGGSVGTPADGIEAEVLRVESLEALGALEADGAAGKIVFIDQRMERTKDGSGYGKAVAKRVAGASAAAEKGATALLIRSAGTSTHRIGHTGTMRYRDDVAKIPAAALSNHDADRLAGHIAMGDPVRFHLTLGARHEGEAESANVIAEVIGRELPEEIVVLAAHLDSWDQGTGAIDDGVGCAIVSAAAKLIAEMPQAPRRTIRVVLTANEEFGLSGALAYGERYADAMDDHVAAMEADFGAGSVWAFRSLVPEDQLPLIADIAQLLAPLGIEPQGKAARGGADLTPLRQAGVPVFDLAQDGSLYFDVHHTADDTLDKIDPAALRQNVAAYATLAYLLAEHDGDLGRVPPPEDP